MTATDLPEVSEPGDLVRATEQTDTIRELYRIEHLAMVRMASLIIGSQELAEEAVHDAFVKLLQSDTELIDNLGAYLRRIVVNECNSMGRRSTLGRAKLQIVANLRRSETTVDAGLDHTWEALSALKSQQRTALVLRFYEDLTVNGIAEAMQVPAGTVKSLIHRGLASLEKELSHDD